MHVTHENWHCNEIGLIFKTGLFSEEFSVQEIGCLILKPAHYQIQLIFKVLGYIVQHFNE